MLHVLYVATERRALSQLLLHTPRMTVSRSEACRPTSWYLILERLADGILSVKHGVSTFVIQFFACYSNAATRCYLVDRALVVGDIALSRSI